MLETDWPASIEESQTSGDAMTTLARRRLRHLEAGDDRRHQRLQQASASAALEGIEFTTEDLIELQMFEQQGMTDEEAIACLIEKYRQSE